MTCECKKVIGTLEEERDELAARVERLERAISEFCDRSAGVREFMFRSDLEHAVEEDGPTSLLLHDAGVLRKWAARFGQEAYPKYETKYGEGHYVALTNVSRMLHEEANRIEQESK
jgi:hypothetical protein